MDLKNIVLHQLIKEEGGQPKLNCSDHTLPIDSKDIIDFIERFLKIYNRKRPTQGTFKDDAENYPFQKYVQEYIEGGDFLEFSKKAMSALKRAIDFPSTKGGYVVFIHYIQKGVDFIVTTMLDNSAQFAVDEVQLSIEKLKTLNLDELVRANRVNINKWQNGEEAYLTFIKGKRQVSKFFQVFIGNTDLTSSRINAGNLKNAMQDYMRLKDYDQEKKSKIYNDVKSYVHKMIKQEKDIELKSVSAIINPEEPSFFEDFTIDQDRPVSGSFRSTLNTDFNFLYQSIVKEEGYKLTFEKELVKQGKIKRSGNNIVIKNVDNNILNNEFGK